MIEEPTCMILGAGASAPYGLPVGFELRDLILATVSPGGPEAAARFRMNGFAGRRLDHLDPVTAWSVFLQMLTDAAKLEPLSARFRNAFFRADRSVDWFLRHNDAEFGEIARFQMAAVLLYCEQSTRLSGDWYRLLLEQVFPTSLDELDLSKLSIITFNYDRSFERYFINVLENQYRLPSELATQKFHKIRLIHVYGQLGALDDIQYGDVSKASQAAKGIQLIRPEVDKAMQNRIAPLIESANYINFIGFGFDDDNIKLLKPERFRGKRVYSTSVSLGARARTKAQQTFRVQFHDAKNSPELDAAQLLRTKDLFGPKIKPKTPKQPTLRPRRGSTWVRRWEI